MNNRQNNQHRYGMQHGSACHATHISKGQLSSRTSAQPHLVHHAVIQQLPLAKAMATLKLTKHYTNVTL